MISVLKSVQEEMHGMGKREVSLFSEELDEILGEMKDGVCIESKVDECWNETEKLSNEGISEQMDITNMDDGSDDDDHSSDAEDVMTKTNRLEVQTNICAGEITEYDIENTIYVNKMRTRSK